MDREDLIVWDRHWKLPNADDRNNTRSGENREPLHDIEAAKHVAREEREFNFSYTIRPTATLPVAGEISLVTLIS